MRTRPIWYAVICVAAAGALLTAISPAASADTGTTTVDGGTVDTDTGQKSDLVPIPAPHPSPGSTCTSGNASVSHTTNGGGSAALVAGSTHFVESNGWRTYYDFTNSKSDFRWLGSNPYYAYSMEPKMAWETNGVDIDLRVPGGATFHDSGNDTITWAPGTNSHIWHQTLSYPGDIHFQTTFGSISSAVFHLGVSIQYTKGNYFYASATKNTDGDWAC